MINKARFSQSLDQKITKRLSGRVLKYLHAFMIFFPKMVDVSYNSSIKFEWIPACLTLERCFDTFGDVN